MAEQQPLSEAERKQAINTILWELAGRSMQAARLTGDPRLAKIAAVAAEQVKLTESFDDLLIQYAQSGQQRAPANPTQTAFAQAQVLMAQQNDQWTQVLEQQKASTAMVNAEINSLTQVALQALKERVLNDGRTSGSTNPSTGTEVQLPASSGTADPTMQPTGSMPTG